MRGNVHSSRGENVLDRNGYQDIDEVKMRARRLSVYEAQENKTAIEEVSSSSSSKKKDDDDDDDVAPIPQNTPLAAVLVTGDVEETKEQYTHDSKETDKHDDALFDAYKKFMVDRFTHESDSDSWRISSSVIDNTTHQVPCRRIDNQSLHEGQSYLASMKHVIEMKNRARRHHRGRQIATGVTRRFMHELQIAKENMCIHQRLLHITPSTDVDRKRHYKDFVKSRALLGKMSRYDMVHAMPHSTRPDWVDSF